MNTKEDIALCKLININTVHTTTILEQDMFDAVILVDGGEEVQIELELAMRERRSRKRHWFVNKVMTD